MNILLNKENFKVLTLFKIFLSCIKHNMNKYIRIRIDNDIEYFNKDFMKYIAERDIWFKLIIVKNS